MTRAKLTKLGRVFTALAIAFYLASVTSQSSLLLCLVALLSTCLGINFFHAKRAARGLRILPPARLRCTEGEPLHEPWGARNEANVPAAAVAISIGGQPFFTITHLAAGDESMISAMGAFPARGVYQGSTIEIRTNAPFGLVEAACRSTLASDLVVYPRIYPIEPPAAAGFDQMVGGKQSGKHRVQSGSQFAGIRPWTHGDSFKQIHWKSSARGQGMMVKQFEEELSGRTAVVLFLDPSSDRPDREAAIRAAGSLIFAGLDVGNHVDFIDTAMIRSDSYAPFEDGEAILERLARLDAGLVFAGRGESALALAHPKAALCLVCSNWSEAGIEFVRLCEQAGKSPQIFVARGESKPAEEVYPTTPPRSSPPKLVPTTA